jgi:hypothetical protein
MDQDVLPGETYSYRLQARDEDGIYVAAGPMSITLAEPAASPVLLSASENPTSGAVVFTAPKLSESEASLCIFDVGGRLVRTLNLAGDSNTMKVVWDGADQNGAPLASGIYFVRPASSEIQPLKLVLLR